LSNRLVIERQNGDDCPVSCTTDGGTISIGEETEALDFCAGDVKFTVSHETTADSTSSYWYVIVDEDGEIRDWQSAEEGGDFDLSRISGGSCRVYGYSTDDISNLDEGEDIEDLEEGCGSLSSNFITINKQVGGECDEGCHTPRDVRIKRNGRNKWSVKWDRVSEARGYTVLVGFQGVPTSFAEVPVRRNKIKLTGPADRVLVIQIRAECGFGESSPYTEEFVLSEESGASSFVATGRNFDVQHGTVLPSGIIISEQALAFPNPAIDQVTVWYDGRGLNGQLSVFSQTGQRVMTTVLDGGKEWHDVSVEGLSSGMYFITIQNSESMDYQDKLIIAR